MEHTKELQLVSYEQAKKLVKLGFCCDEANSYSIYKWYATTPSGDMEIWESSFTNITIPAPTVSLALKWCRQEKGMYCSVFQVQFIGKGSNEYSFSYSTEYGHFYTENIFSTYENAESALLDNILTLLEQQ